MTAALETLERDFSGVEPMDDRPRPASPGPTVTRRRPVRLERRPTDLAVGRQARCHQPRVQRAADRPEPVRPSRAVVRRRRLLLGTVAVALLTALALPWGGTGGRSLATPGTALAGASLQAHERYVVEPGDTLWSIAVRLDPTGDPRPIVAQLEAQVGGDVVVPGERLQLP